MAKKKSKSASKVDHGTTGGKMSPIVQLGVVFIIVAAMFLLMYAGKLMR